MNDHSKPEETDASSLPADAGAETLRLDPISPRSGRQSRKETSVADRTLIERLEKAAGVCEFSVELSALLREAAVALQERAASTVSEWQPIETAPKGRWLWLFGPGWSEPCIGRVVDERGGCRFDAEADALRAALRDILTASGQSNALENVIRIARDALLSAQGASTPPVQPEVCICAAVKLPDGEVWRGHRHDGAMTYAMAAGVSRDAMIAGEQGFITSRDRFVSREEGARLQRAAGIVSADTGQPVGNMLFSEDLYLRNWREAEGATPDASRSRLDGAPPGQGPVTDEDL